MRVSAKERGTRTTLSHPIWKLCPPVKRPDFGSGCPPNFPGSSLSMFATISTHATGGDVICFLAALHLQRGSSSRGEDRRQCQLPLGFSVAIYSIYRQSCRWPGWSCNGKWLSSLFFVLRSRSSTIGYRHPRTSPVSPRPPPKADLHQRA